MKGRKGPAGARRRGQKLPDLIRRMRALESVRARFEGQPLELGKSDCLRIARYHLVRMGHEGLPKVPPYRTVVGARKALKDQGVDTLSELLDKHLGDRIPPAMMLPGDLVVVDGTEEEGGETILISAGTKLWGFHQDSESFTLIEPFAGAIKQAWRA